ncbi:hypothetical protein [Enterobacter sp. R1(2018)]|uniref:hypothetical protein n=1 Tax=Enterobacter sp. R1(2018) TaxID=2447891 RepID=UPI0011C4AD00
MAAPVCDGGNIIGVLSVGKPNSAMEPVIHRSERRILWVVVVLLVAGILFTALSATMLLTRYIDWYGMAKKGEREKGSQQDPERFRLWK